jgi:PIN domain nuclease of toxin-antitoxin system
MTVLVDTQAIFWFANDPSKLSASAASLMLNTNTELLLSIASVWALSIKIGIGKLDLGVPLDHFVRHQLPRSGVALLPISPSHAISAGQLPLHHRDPFDRMLAAQSLASGYPIVSSDPIFDRYEAARLW